MAIIPERILQNVIVDGIRELRKSPAALAYMFQDLSDAEFQDITTFITLAPLRVEMNYPRADVTPPMIVLTLQSENEAEAFLGDVMGSGTAANLLGSPMTKDTGTGTGSVSTLSGLSNKLIGGVGVEVASEDQLSIATADLTSWTDFLNTYPSVPARLYVTAGAGAGKEYSVVTLLPTSVSIHGVFDPPVDETSVFDIREFDSPMATEGQPYRAYNGDEYITLVGANYEMRYKIDVVAGSQDQVIYLHYILKSLFFLYKARLEKQGIQALKISASDLAPRSEFLPDELFHRTMTLTFKMSFSTIREEVVFKNIVQCITPQDPLTLEGGERLITSIVLEP